MPSLATRSAPNSVFPKLQSKKKGDKEDEENKYFQKSTPKKIPKNSEAPRPLRKTPPVGVF